MFSLTHYATQSNIVAKQESSMRGRRHLWITYLLLSACDVGYFSQSSPETRPFQEQPPIQDRSPTAPDRPLTDQQREVLRMAADVLSQIQLVSIKENIEYCGYIVLNPDNMLKILVPEPS